MNHNIRPLVEELLQLKAKLIPLEATFERKKEEIRSAGADTYEVPGKGKVTVAAATQRAPKGTAIVLDPEKLAIADPKLTASLFELGILRTDTIYSRACKARVEVTPEMA
ncbi:hypothetical protein [Aquibium oceanicum]|uniref:Uncharacterized protein n=1 Tax=Aquibium oceanicum TaxID=1670800 RepID=A0A1L3SXF1_9HYPH|nr:hypothetical protein [Aquibium oceanicum]APH74106.1 hypothetical protein BSQ44_24110 [Aquibium oceanicum]